MTTIDHNHIQEREDEKRKHVNKLTAKNSKAYSINQQNSNKKDSKAVRQYSITAPIKQQQDKTARK